MFTRRSVAPLSAAIGAACLLAATSPAWAGLCAFCGSNAATVGDGIVFDELSVNPGPGQGERGGPFLRGARMENGGQVRLAVTGDRLSATRGNTTFEGPTLRGLIISLEMKDGRAYEVKLTAFNEPYTFWAAPHSQVPAYTFHVKKINRKAGVAANAGPGPYDRLSDTSDAFEMHLCGEDDKDKYVRRGPDERTPNPQPDQKYAAFVFEGDHYTRNHTVTDGSSGRFNLACFGTAAAKMHLLRYTRAGTPSDGSQPKTHGQRTAMLRAITADYCGDGRAWTGDGTPLWWTDRDQRFPLNVQPDFAFVHPQDFAGKIEAAWGTEGKLLCLNEPRRTPAEPAIPLPPSVDCSIPGVRRSEVIRGRNACPRGGSIPRCDAFDWSRAPTDLWSDKDSKRRGPPLSGAQIITVNRPPMASYCEDRRITWPDRP